jgi:hypothetical protein
VENVKSDTPRRIRIHPEVVISPRKKRTPVERRTQARITRPIFSDCERKICTGMPSLLNSDPRGGADIQDYEIRF